MEDRRYAGFWVRVGAVLIDTLLLFAIIIPALIAIYGSAYWSHEAAYAGVWDVVLNHAFPAMAIIGFWIYCGATPGKMLLGIRIVDAGSGEPVPPLRCVGRYLGYFVSSIALLLGFLWVAFDRNKQGWHDKLAGTAVVHTGAG